MAYKAKGRDNHKRRYDDSEYAEGKSMHVLKSYLCSLARPSPKGEVYVEACRGCVSQCGFGRQYVRLYDAGAPEKKVRGAYKPRQHKQASKKDKPVSTTTILEETEKMMRRRLTAEANTTDNGGAHTWPMQRAVIS